MFTSMTRIYTGDMIASHIQMSFSEWHKLSELAVRVRHRYVREVQSLCGGHGTLDMEP